ncbi:hypothetical protein K3G63_11590 [Hymenobacter sp. HSC-4F20]|uniref:hypothetical protein n=1 Tax=Hymenobacter sp. HSC-4F20 TaxID=2864135 RepID=UPI001C72C1A7|nr:hypothetical protein [Hymenobacter sp. HSC-4F20]MBX0291088.1 hypothetical protein [Hymenobacter sp. HSC-4F20]
MKKVILILLLLGVNNAFSQRILVSWSQRNIEGLTKEEYDEVQKLSSEQLTDKNVKDASWADVFLTLNASVNNYSKDKIYLRRLANQITNRSETKLTGTSRLIIWDRIISNDILFEGKGLVIDNDLFQVAGRANEILQNLTGKKFGYVTPKSAASELAEIKGRWLDYLSDKQIEEVKSPAQVNAKIPEVSSMQAFHALVVSLNDNSKKSELTKGCLKTMYNLDTMPVENSSAMYCNPDTYTFAYLTTLVGDEKFDKNKDAKWWNDFWNRNQSKLKWNSARGCYEVE